MDADALGGTHTINVAAGIYTLTLGEIIFGNTAQNITIIGAGAESTIISMTSGDVFRMSSTKTKPLATRITMHVWPFICLYFHPILRIK